MKLKASGFGLAVVLICNGLSVSAHAGFSIDGEIEFDTDLEEHEVGGSEDNQDYEVEVNFAADHQKGDHFIRSLVKVDAEKDEDLDTDELWVQFGSSAWDLQLGRFEAVELFPEGEDTVIEHAGDVDVYVADAARGVIDDAEQVALHLNVSDAVSIELSTIFGEDDDGFDISGVRPVITYSADAFSVIAGYEVLDSDTGDTKGVGVTAGLILEGGELNINYARSDESNNEDITSIGVNYTRDNFGIGAIASEVDEQGAANPSVVTLYTSYRVPLFDISGAFVSLGVSTSRSDNADPDDKLTVARLRFSYLF